MLVADWMTRNPTTIGPDAPLSEAASLMKALKARRLPVLVGDRLVGILSLTDLHRASTPGVNALSVDPGLARAVRDLMTVRPITIAPDAPLETAAEIMVARKFGALPVMQGERLVGIVTESDVFRAFTAVLALSTEGVRVTFSIRDDEDVIPMLATRAAAARLRVTGMFVHRTPAGRHAVVRLEGPTTATFVDELWRLGHRVISVVRTPPPPD